MLLNSEANPVLENHRQLASYMADGCKPKEAWRIGTEHEKFGYCKDTLQPLPYEGARSIKAVLEGLQNQFSWQPVYEGEYIIGLTKDGASVSLEPAGALELSGAPLETVHQTCNEVHRHLYEVQQVCDQMRVGFLGLGAAPTWTHEQMPLMPKGRYKLMDAYMETVGTMGRDMMRRTCTVQVNLDFSSEADMVQKLRVALALQPVATALFANSPFFEGKPNGHKSWRSRIWRDLDPARTGMLPWVFEEGMGFEKWVDYALDVPMYFVYRDGKYIDALGQSFRDFMKGQLPALLGEKPRLSDWADHLTTIFPEARVKQFIEMRGADGGPWKRLCALPAFWVGLTYDQTALDAAWDLCKAWTSEQRQALYIASSEQGLSADTHGLNMQDIARQAVDIAHAGLLARSKADNKGQFRNETHFLETLQQTVLTGQTSADELLLRYHSDWGQDLSQIYEAYSY